MSDKSLKWDKGVLGIFRRLRVYSNDDYSYDKAKTQLRELVMSAIPKKKELKFNSSTEELIRISQNTVITETTKAIEEVLK